MTGHAGLALVCESLPCTPALQELILSGAPRQELRRAAVREGMQTLRASGLERACEGSVSLEEVLLHTPSDVDAGGAGQRGA
jgi:type II secretory ATPase GspE/PulE/Tfp pilus assembly ATPase PilB-like protein